MFQTHAVILLSAIAIAVDAAMAKTLQAKLGNPAENHKSVDRDNKGPRDKFVRRPAQLAIKSWEVKPPNIKGKPGVGLVHKLVFLAKNAKHVAVCRTDKATEKLAVYNKSNPKNPATLRHDSSGFWFVANEPEKESKSEEPS